MAEENNNWVVKFAETKDHIKIHEISSIPEVKVWQLKSHDKNESPIYNGLPFLSSPLILMKHRIWYLMMVEIKDVAVGVIFLTPLIAKGECLIGWNFIPDVWGKGIAYSSIYDVVTRVKNSGLFKSIRCHTSEDNVRCLGLIKKLNFINDEIKDDLSSYYEKNKKSSFKLIVEKI